MWHFIALDTHCHGTDLVCLDDHGRMVRKWNGPTTIPALVAAMESIPEPRAIAFEEGPLADWLFRNLQGHARRLIVCNPRRNALIAKDSDKDDAIDAEKLADLLRGGYLQPVHHNESEERSIFKQTVAMYHRTVQHRVREANRIIAQFRQWGVFVKEADFRSDELWSEQLSRLPEDTQLRGVLGSMFCIYRMALEQEIAMRRRMIQRTRREEVIRRWCALPGISWIRGATFFVYLDTPWRFGTKSQLWRYMGVGLERRHSGGGPTVVRLSHQANHHLKGAILGAAKSAIAIKKNPFADQYRRWRDTGLSHCIARRNVARSLAATVWSMWKHGDVYRPELVAANGRRAPE
jgi:transposase